MKQRFRFSLRLLSIVALVLGAAWLSGVRLFAFPGESMVPAVQPGDIFVGLVGLWGHRSPERFDRVIFDVPPDSKWAERKIPWMKRLVGLPGEHVRLAGADLFIDGRKVDSPSLHVEKASNHAAGFSLQLRRDEYCVLGDNLDRSFEDSRSLGPIAGSLIRGRVIWVFHRSKPAPAKESGR